MNTFAVVFLCIQACLVQTAFSQCTSRAAVADAGPYGIAAPSLAYTGFAYPGAGCAGSRLAYDGLAGGYASRALAYDGLTSPFGLGGRGIAGAYGPYGLGGSALAYDGFGYPDAAPYGGAGEGNVAVYGELPVAGNTAVAGQVPIMGAVSFSGPVAAAGAVSIAGKCACGCNTPYNLIY